MRIINLGKIGINKIRSYHLELKASDFSDSIRSLSPDQWCLMQAGGNHWVGYLNSKVAEKYTCAYVDGKIEKSS